MSDLKEKPTVQDVINYLKDELFILEDLVASENLAPEENIRPDQCLGSPPEWERDMFAPRREAIAELEQGKPEKARTILDQAIKDERRHASSEKSLVRVERLRAALDKE